VEEWLRYAIKNKPTVGLLAVWAEFQDLRGRYPQAQEAWRTVLKEKPNHIIALNNLACLLAFSGVKGEEPLRLTNQAISLAGPVPELLDSRALVNLSQGNPALAVDDLVLAVKRRPTASKYYHLSRAYQAAGDTVRARDSWRKAVEAKLKAEDLHPLEAEEYKKYSAKMAAG
jgi:tetratricopeptide (TPR) repeat protein